TRPRRPPGRARFRDLWRHRRFVFAVVAQFFYVGAQVGIWSYLIRYLQDAVPGTPEKTAAGYLTLSLVLFMAGRFLGTALLRFVAPARLLGGFALVNLLLCAVAAMLPGWTGLYALVAASLFMSVMFPTIFALGLEGLGDDERKLGASLLVMAIIGGALLTALMGAVSDHAGIHWAMAVPGLCFAVILAFALRAGPPLRS
ncbi:sugar MFS transporter, partial [Xanthomonas sp. Kuri4-1]